MKDKNVIELMDIERIEQNELTKHPNACSRGQKKNP